MAVRKITVCPKGPFNHEARYQGELLCVSEEPMLSTARKLLAAGLAAEGLATEDDVIEMWREGDLCWSLRSRLGRAAALHIREDDQGLRRVPYRQSPFTSK